MTTGKTIALTRQTFVSKVMSLHFNMLSKLVIVFFQGASFNFMAANTICSDFGAQENKNSHCFHCFPIYLQWSEVTGSDTTILVFWMQSFKPTFSLSSFTFIKRLFSSFSLYAIRVVSSAYLKLLIFLLAILIPTCASQSGIWHDVLCIQVNKQGDNIQPWHTPFPIWN